SPTAPSPSRITCSTSVVSPNDTILKRVGLSLQRMLQAEYGGAYELGKYRNPIEVMERRNPLLATIQPRAALELRIQLRAYVNSAEPFNRKRRSTDT
ncbi:hypothetical protein J3R83DRAFT_9754, partial [Lanmaoa asiatica]